MSKYWSEVVKKVTPYVPGEQPKDMKYIKLNANENPYGPSPRVIEAIKKASDENLRVYPDANCNELRSTVAEYYNLKKEQIFVGNGSDELLAFCFLAFFNPGKAILFPNITYSFYPVYANLFKIDFRVVALDGEFKIPVEEFFTENGGVIIPNPNAPTAKYLNSESIKAILEHNKDSVVIVDEAYIDFGGESAINMIEDYPNLLVMQTLSKSRSLAGLRVGLVAGNENLIEAINRVKNSINSYTLGRIPLAGAVEAIKDESYFQESRMRVIKTRERVSSELLKLGFEMTDSKANFIFISHPNYSAESLFLQLRERGILVRHFNQPIIDNHLRVSIGKEEDMDRFLETVKEIIKC